MIGTRRFDRGLYTSWLGNADKPAPVSAGASQRDGHADTALISHWPNCRAWSACHHHLALHPSSEGRDENKTRSLLSVSTCGEIVIFPLLEQELGQSQELERNPDGTCHVKRLAVASLVLATSKEGTSSSYPANYRERRQKLIHCPDLGAA